MWSTFIHTLEGWNSIAIIGRLALAIVTGTVIGIDRGLKRRGAGIKTHSLVCLGSTLVMLTSEYMAMNFDQKADLARLGAQVISGVGFLGVGTILVTEKQRITGLWTCACVGLAIGIGFVEGAIYTLIFIVVALRLLNRIDIFLQKHAKIFDLYLEMDNGKSVGMFLQEMRKKQIRAEAIETTKTKVPGSFSSIVVTIWVEHYKMRAELIDEIRNLDYVHYVEEM